MNIRPLHDWVLLEPAEAEEMSSGGIIIPESAKEKPQRGTVIAAGPGVFKTEKERGKKAEEKKFVPAEVKPGDSVLYEKYMTREFETGGGRKIVMVRESSILGVFVKDAGDNPIQKKGTTALQKKAPSELQKKGPTEIEKTKKTAKPKSGK